MLQVLLLWQKTTPFETLLIFCQFFISPLYFQLLLHKGLSQKWCRNSKTFKNFIYSWWIWCLFKSSYPCHYNLLAGLKCSSLVFSLVLCLKDLKIYLHYFLTYIYAFFLFFFYIPDSVFPSIISWPLLFCVSFGISSFLALSVTLEILRFTKYLLALFQEGSTYFHHHSTDSYLSAKLSPKY